eukprot:CAMPEP_0194757008 /NCGR_PEP_ID=MMETSP0323_2-20130528/10614_1 /TAXON_ID=2866 ORGANISM="Crypthecodinium cohnii, Strain Seligo" /NCGR_SAMPLE_ID=MMETSP0323_2 /ASSEMBLY_ACC=CAM_ASM_000346 /LENGTH=73 /DNA_ID=CAMNT_0039676785 /DNA_START=157 /DNA_END=378 /DNA_ORIENTATION=-
MATDMAIAMAMVLAFGFPSDSQQSHASKSSIMQQQSPFAFRSEPHARYTSFARFVFESDLVARVSVVVRKVVV